MRRLVRIELKLAFERRSLWNRAERATPCTKIAQDHEGCGSAMEALVNIGTASRFAHRVQIARTQFRLEKMNGLKMCSALAKPLRQAWTSVRSRLNLNEGTQVGEPTIVPAPTRKANRRCGRSCSGLHSQWRPADCARYRYADAPRATIHDAAAP